MMWTDMVARQRGVIILSFPFPLPPPPPPPTPPPSSSSSPPPPLALPAVDIVAGVYATRLHHFIHHPLRNRCDGGGRGVSYDVTTEVTSPHICPSVCRVVSETSTFYCPDVGSWIGVSRVEVVPVNVGSVLVTKCIVYSVVYIYIYNILHICI